jgi:serine/threonine protein kinase
MLKAVILLTKDVIKPLMPPEQAEGRITAIDARSDVYSLGATLYEMLTGQTPFKGSTSFNMLYQIMTHEPIPPRAIKNKVPKELECICLKALEKKKEHRYQSAAELSDDLKLFLQGEPVHARPVTLWRRSLKFFRRHRAVLITAFIFLSPQLSLVYFISELLMEPCPKKSQHQ